MKKLYLIGFLTLSSLAIAGVHSPTNGQHQTMHNMPMIVKDGHMTPEMSAHMKEMGMLNKNTDLSKLTFTAEQAEFMKTHMSSVEGNENLIDLELKQKKPDWGKVEKLNEEIAKMKAIHSTELLKWQYRNMKNQ